ncbi:MAG: hypothetical protein WC479_09395 [Candidatus Izemoplasmatales bacterium]|jgi:hypothetical protein
MEVRDRTEDPKTYSGSKAEAKDKECPCRSCFRIHDFGHSDHEGKWVTNYRCWSREQGGCPNPIPEPEHKFVSTRAYVCRRCGHRRKKGGSR